MEVRQEANIQVLANGEGMFFDRTLKKHLYNKHKIAGKHVGIDKSTKNMKDFIIGPYLLDKVSVCFLIQNEPQLFHSENLSAFKQVFEAVKVSLELRVFRELKQKYFLIDGHKFGSVFLAYDENPEKNHAKALVFCGQKTQAQSNFNHMTRLAQIAKKDCIFAYLNQQDGKIITQKLVREKKQKTKRENKQQKLEAKSVEKQNE